MRRVPLFPLLLTALLSLPAGAMGPFHENPPEVVEGMAALAAGKPQEALDAFDAAKARLGSRPELEHNRALALAELGQREEAAAIFKELADDPALSRELRAKSAYNLGNVHAAGSARKEAISAYRQALTLQPGDTDARHNLEVLLRNVPPKQDAPADGGQDTPDGGEPEETGEDGGQDGGDDGGESGDSGEPDSGEGDQHDEEGDTNDAGEDGEGDEDEADGGEDGEQEGETPEDGGEDPGSSDSEEGEEDAGSDGGDDEGDAGDSSDQAPDAGQMDGGEGDAGEDAGDEPADGDGEDGDAGSDGGEASDQPPEDADEGPERGSGAGNEAPEPSEGEQEGISAQEAEGMLDAMKQDERNLQLWRFQGRKRPRDANQKDW